MKRVAIQISGELRNFNTASMLYKKVKELFNQEGVELDFFLHCWDNEYSREIEQKGLFDFINDYSMDVIDPKFIYKSEAKKYSYVENSDPRAYTFATGLQGWSYSMYKSSRLRRLYQKDNNITYDYILICRPDSYFRENVLRQLIMSIKEEKEEYFMALFRRNIMKEVKGEQRWLGYKGDDSVMFGTQEAINLYSTNFHLHFINPPINSVPQGHNIPGLTAMKYRLDIIGSNHNFNISGELLRNDDGRTIMKGNKVRYIEEFYLR